MRRIVRENAVCALLAGAASATMAWLGLYGFAWNDYDNEARPAFDALVHGHAVEFLRLVPAYGGSLVERAPFALIPSLWGGGQLAVYRMVSLPCLLAAAALAVWLLGRMRTEGRPGLARSVVLGLCVANPLTLSALELGHPEELLGACMCVAAVLLASRDRPLLAAVLLGLAIANKEWALLAIGPVLLALPKKRRLPCLALAGLLATTVLLPLA
ncbi:MAG TPA: glycosyltransferase 87 family protein, partial [Solirubrobacteraceae bacterium]|nr:glycosyltransferase 87 family protein [Solirubrobacteraceae bacterium]